MQYSLWLFYIWYNTSTTFLLCSRERGIWMMHVDWGGSLFFTMQHYVVQWLYGYQRNRIILYSGFCFLDLQCTKFDSLRQIICYAVRCSTRKNINSDWGGVQLCILQKPWVVVDPSIKYLQVAKKAKIKCYLRWLQKQWS